MTEQQTPRAKTFAVGHPHTAVGQPGGAFQIYDDQGDLIYTLPAGTNQMHIPHLVTLIESEKKRSYENGLCAGAYQIQKQLRTLIGAAEAEQ